MVALATVAAVISIGSSLLGAFGAKKKGDAQAKAFELNARSIEKRASIETVMSERKFFKGIGATKADIAGAGLTLGGSAGDLLRESARDAEFEVQSIASVAKLEAAAERLGAASARTAGTIGAIAGVAQAGVAALDLFAPKKGDKG